MTGSPNSYQIIKRFCLCGFNKNSLTSIPNANEGHNLTSEDDLNKTHLSLTDRYR